MRTPIPILLILTLSGPLCLAGANPQDANKLVEQYVKAAGGPQALGKIRSLTIEGTITTADGRTGTYTLDLKAPNRYYSELVIGGKTLIEAYNGKSAWRQNSAGEISTLLGADGVQLEAAGQYYNSRLVDLKKTKLSVSFVGHAQVRGKDALQIEVSGTPGVKRQVFFDPQTHLIVKESGPVGGVDEILYDDYRAVAGVKLPYRIELHRGSDVYPVAVTHAALDETVGERVFDFPKKSQVRLPDLKALFEEIEQNQKAIVQRHPAERRDALFRLSEIQRRDAVHHRKSKVTWRGHSCLPRLALRARDSSRRFSERSERFVLVCL
jgi:hypothetical protein